MPHFMVIYHYGIEVEAHDVAEAEDKAAKIFKETDPAIVVADMRLDDTYDVEDE